METEGKLSDQLIEETLELAGFDLAALDQSYRDDRGKWDGLMRRNSEQASLIGLQGTPAFIIGTTLYPGSMDAAALKEAVELARS